MSSSLASTSLNHGNVTTQMTKNIGSGLKASTNVDSRLRATTQTIQPLTLYLIEMPFNAFTNRANNDQTAFLRVV